MLHNIRRSLMDLIGTEYLDAVINARASLTQEDPAALRAVAEEKVDFYPDSFALRQEELMAQVGQRFLPAFSDNESGAPTDSYRAAQHSSAAPLSLSLIHI